MFLRLAANRAGARAEKIGFLEIPGNIFEYILFKY